MSITAFSGILRTSQVFLPDYEGILYPKERKVLSGQVGSFLDHARKSPTGETPEILLVPAGEYVHIGGLLADAYSQVNENIYDAIVIIAPSTDPQQKGITIFPGKYFRTLLGVLSASDPLAQTLIDEQSELFSISNSGFAGNYHIEVQLPFILEVFGNIDILPLAVGNLDSQEIHEAVSAIAGLKEERNVLYIVVTNPEESLSYQNMESVQLYWEIANLKTDAFLENEKPDDSERVSEQFLFGLGIELAKKIDATYSEIYRMNNNIGISGTPGHFMTYISAGFYSDQNADIRFEPGLTNEEIRYLLYYAYYLVQKRLVKAVDRPYIPSYILNKNLGVHVAIVKDGELIGSGAELFSHRPISELLESSIDYALFSDPVTGSIDLNRLKGANLRLTFVGRARRIFTHEVIPEHGLLYMKSGNSSSMAFCRVGRHADARVFRDLCLRAGLLYNCYEDEMTEIYHFETETGNIVLEFNFE